MRRRQAILLLFPLLALLALLGGCGGDNTYNPALVGEGPGAGPSFSLAVAPASRTVVPGQSAAYTATLTAQNGFESAVALTVSGLPEGAEAAFAPASVTPTSGGATSALTVTTEAEGSEEERSGRVTPTGTYTLTVTGTGGGVTRQAQVTLVVEQGVGVTVNPPTAAVPINGQQAFTATVVGTSNTAVTWSVQPGGSAGGTISAEGVYTAPGSPGTDTVVATSVADPTRQGTATVTVQSGNLVGEIR
jgi:hypothetical protein